jgi:hypothetical protein
MKISNNFFLNFDHEHYKEASHVAMEAPTSSIYNMDFNFRF